MSTVYHQSHTAKIVALKILGIDPGTQNLGFGIIEKIGNRLTLIDAGVIKFRDRDLQNILRRFPEELNSILESNEIESVAVESLFFSKNPQSVLKLAQFRGALLHYLLNRFERVFEYSPLEIKESLTGTGRGTKEQVNFMVKKLLGVRGEIKPLDISDALAVAITHSQRANYLN
jgi:crossover junction endodeoxyribonuclease RuvC